MQVKAKIYIKMGLTNIQVIHVCVPFSSDKLLLLFNLIFAMICYTPHRSHAHTPINGINWKSIAVYTRKFITS